MKQIEDYLESVFRNYKTTQDILDFKEETKTHLLESVRELIAEGKTEAESVSLAIERFGGGQYFNGELERVLNARRVFAKWLLNLTLVFLVVGLLSGGVFKRIENHFYQTQTAFNQQVFSVFPSRDFRIHPKQLRKIEDFAQQDGIQIKSVAVFHSPGITIIPNRQPLANHVYSANVDANTHSLLGFATTSSSPNAMQWSMYVEYRLVPYVNPVLILIPFGFLVGYWILFAVWASVNAHQRRKLNIGWVLMFACLNCYS